MNRKIEKVEEGGQEGLESKNFFNFFDFVVKIPHIFPNWESLICVRRRLTRKLFSGKVSR
jgi:hypothetical protein